MVIFPALHAGLFWAHLHHGNHVVPGIAFVLRTDLEVSHLIAVNRSGSESCNLSDDMWTEERFLN